MEKGHPIEVPPCGYVRYVDHFGSDERVVEAARVSYLSPSKGPEADKKLLGYLLKNRHTSPFEQCSITYQIKMPVFVMRQFVRHRTFRLNEWSGRYSELKDEFYKPSQYGWRAQSKTNKQGSDESTSIDHAQCHLLLHNAYQAAYTCYQELLHAGVAKEQARVCLPVGIYTLIYVNCDLHNLMHFLRLRLDSHAQAEIREFAAAMREIAQELFPWTFEFFNQSVTGTAVS